MPSSLARHLQQPEPWVGVSSGPAKTLRLRRVIPLGGSFCGGGAMRQFRVGLTITLAVYGVALLAAPVSWSFIDNINLPVHETGHLVFAPLGHTFQLLGGTFLQLLLPLAFAAYFTAHRDEHAASIGIWWVGQNFMNISTFMAEAQPLSLSLRSGGDHDWNILFAEWGVSFHAAQYAQLAHGFGFLVMVVATIWGLFDAMAREQAPAARIRYNHARRR